MKRVTPLEVRDIIEARLPRLIRQVECHTPVKAQYEEVEIIPKANTSTYGHLTENILQFK